MTLTTITKLSGFALALAMAAACAPAQETATALETAPAQETAPGPLVIARQGYLFAGGTYSTVDDQQVMSGQLYAEFQIPADQRHSWPIVMVHGAGQTGTNFTGTPDGREGWAQFFLREGYAVYVVDQAGRGRSAHQADVYPPVGRVRLAGAQERFAAPEHYNQWPQARLHTQWPGEGKPGDPIFDQFYASQVPSIQGATFSQSVNRDALLALLEEVGPAILLTHSQSGPYGWPVADARPDLVKAVVAVEPSGPPFFQDAAVDTRPRPWGPTNLPLTYSPPAADASELAIVQQETPDGPDLVRCWTQQEPARTLPNLQKVPVVILTGEASYHAQYDHCTPKLLEQAGVQTTFINLADIGIRGNGHMMMLEKNILEIAAVMIDRLDKTLAEDSE